MHYKFSLFLLFLLRCVFVSQGQENSYTDSLEAILKVQSNDTNKIKTLNELAWEFSFSDFKKAKIYCNKSIELATKLSFLKGRSSAYNTLGNISSDEANNDEALRYYLLSLKDKQSIKDEKGVATVYNNIGIVYGIMGDYSKAGEYYNLALSKRKVLGDKKGIADCFNNLGNMYRKRSLYVSALANFNEAKEIRLQIDDKKGVAFALNNIATVYGDQADFISALNCYYEAAKILEKENDENSLARVYNNIGILNEKLRNYKEAINYSNLALAFSKEIGNKAYEINSYDNLGNSYLAIKKYTEAKLNYKNGMLLAKQADNKEMIAQFYMGIGLCCENDNQIAEALANYNKAIKIAKETGELKSVVKYSNILALFYVNQNRNKEAVELLEFAVSTAKAKGLRNELRSSYKILAEYYQTNLNNLKQSNVYYKLYCNLNDSLFSEDMTQKFAEQQTKYETEKKVAEIKLLKQQEDLKSLQLKDQELMLEKRKYMLLGGAIFILFVSIAAYFYFSKQKLKSMQIQEQSIRVAEENERIRMAKDIHDDLGSGLSKIKILSEIISSKAEHNPEIKSGIKSISETAVSLVDNMRDLIWALNPENTSLDSLIVRIREHSSDYLNDFPIDIKFDINEYIPSYNITKEAHRNIFFILKESLQNIVKHSRASLVTIKMESDMDFKLVIIDNGSGFGQENSVKGNGLINIKQRAEIIGGKTEFVSNSNGVSLCFIFPFKDIMKS